MNLRLIYLFATAVLLLTGCFKDVSYKTDYILKPQVRIVSGSPTTPLAAFRAYAYAVDTTRWTVASYDDAVAGIITSKSDPAEKISEPIATAEPYEREGTTGWFRMMISNPSQMVLAVDMENKLYAYTQQELGVNLPNLYVAVVFQPWKGGTSYKDGSWSYYDDFYVPPTYVNFFVAPAAQEVEDGPPTTIPLLKVTAFAADTTLWYVASYDDAVAGVVTLKEDPTVTLTNSVSGTEDEGLYRLRVSSPMLMVVVANRTNKLYAYSRQDIDLEADPVTVPIIFRTWKQEYLYQEPGGWRVVNPALKPADPILPSQRNR